MTAHDEKIIEAVARAIWVERENQFSPRVRRDPDQMDKATGAWPMVFAQAKAAIQAYEKAKGEG